MKTILCSQDSLASTGSNQELRIELETSLAEVKAAVEDVIVCKSSSETLEKPMAEMDTLLELAGRTPGSREGVGRQLSNEGFELRQKSPETGARPKSGQTPPAVTPRTVRINTTADPEGVLLKQNSWASRKGPREQESVENVSVFAKKKDMWEKRTTSSNSPSADEGSNETRSSFRGNRNFWEQKTSVHTNTPGQTPDLVMDLPAGPLASSPPVPAPRPRRSKSRSPSSDSASGRSTASSEGSPSGAYSTQPGSLSSADNFAAITDTLKKTPSSLVPPSPKPRPQPLSIPTTPGSTVVPIRSPGPRTPKVMAKFSGSGSGSPSLDSVSSFASSSSSFKPSVRVKPVLQVKPEIKKDNPKDLK